MSLTSIDVLTTLLQKTETSIDVFTILTQISKTSNDVFTLANLRYFYKNNSLSELST
jgi:hypothetical protein